MNDLDAIESLHARIFGDATRVAIEIPWETPPKKRPRVGPGHTYAEDAEAEANTAMALLTSWAPRKRLSGNCALTVVAYRGTKRRVDIDNLAKHIMDAGNDVIWLDDVQVIGLHALKAYDPDRPRTLVCVSSYDVEV